MPIPSMDINMLPVSTIKAFLFIRDVSNRSESHAKFIYSQILPPVAMAEAHDVVVFFTLLANQV